MIYISESRWIKELLSICCADSGTVGGHWHNSFPHLPQAKEANNIEVQNLNTKKLLRAMWLRAIRCENKNLNWRIDYKMIF